MRGLFLLLLLALGACKNTIDADMDAAAPPADLAVGLDMRSSDLAAASCTDSVKNGGETDVDCGGPSCPKCELGKGCGAASDCSTGQCNATVCVGPGCMDGVQNGDETGPDCGGSCMVPCRAGLGCKVNADCVSRICTSGKCAAPGCADGLTNGSETDVDCGGGACEQCGPNKGCKVDADCFTKVCDPIGLKCVGCGDGAKNGGETDVDCGGPLCDACSLAKKCQVDKDCGSNLCSGGACTACQVDNDCAFKVCKAGVCSSAPIVGVLNNQTYFKVQVAGAMTDTNVFDACSKAGLKTPCQAANQGKQCMYNDNMCVPTQEAQCGSPMQSLSAATCNGAAPSQCPALYGVYQYMGHAWQNDSSCGAEQGEWCATGSQKMNRFALCTL